MAEEAAIADLISGGRLQLGISRRSPETALNGFESFGYVPADGESDADNQLGVDFNAKILDSITKDVAPNAGWR